MKTVILCISFYSLGIFNCAVFAAVYLLHRPRYVAPTLKRRANRDAPLRGYQPESGKPMGPPPMPIPEAEVGGIEYRFMGATGLEE